MKIYLRKYAGDPGTVYRVTAPMVIPIQGCVTTTAESAKQEVMYIIPHYYPRGGGYE